MKLKGESCDVGKQWGTGILKMLHTPAYTLCKYQGTSGVVFLTLINTISALSGILY